MHKFKFIIFTYVLALASLVQAEIRTVSYVDPARYLGDWYQIANIPLPFEGSCACARQRLGVAEAPNTITVYNSCNSKTPQGRLRDIRGIAVNDDPATNAKFTVDFNFPWKGTYWIVGLDKNYRYAVVTDKHGRSLYILSKTPTLDLSLYAKAVKIAAAQNLKTSKLKLTNQKGCVYPN